MNSDIDAFGLVTWEERGGEYIRRLVRDFALTPAQAAGIVGNLGMESSGFTQLREIGQPEGKGGFGVAQWTADRRVTFLAWAKTNSLDWRSDAANYGYLCLELRTTHKSSITNLKKCDAVDAAIWSFGQTFERPGGTTATHLPGYESRLQWGKRALVGAAQLPDKPIPTPKPIPKPKKPSIIIDRDLLADLIRAVQRIVGADPDGIYGPKTAAAIRKAQKAR